MNHGSCLCGKVKLSTQINPQVGACHCNMCRKWGGSALLGVEAESEVTFSGDDNISIYESSAWAERGFCKHCGTHLFYRLKENKHYYIFVGVFDVSKNLIFNLEVFVEEKPDYYCFANETKKLTGAELFEQFNSSSEE